MACNNSPFFSWLLSQLLFCTNYLFGWGWAVIPANSLASPPERQMLSLNIWMCTFGQAFFLCIWENTLRSHTVFCYKDVGCPPKKITLVVVCLFYLLLLCHNSSFQWLFLIVSCHISIWSNLALHSPIQSSPRRLNDRGVWLSGGDDHLWWSHGHNILE